MSSSSKTIVAGLTGGIASGKSTVSLMLEKKRIPVICADAIAHQVVQQGQPAYKELVRAFGRSILQKNGSLDRKKLAQLVFRNESFKKKLEKIIHPRVRRAMKGAVKAHKKQGTALVVLDVPLLFESGWDEFCDVTLCVWAWQWQQIERLKSRGMTRLESLARIRNQWPLRQKRDLADVVFDNRGTPAQLKKQVEGWLKSIKNQVK